ncbi:MAG: LLM class flavin-dependent oxidoreductase, partial [Chloroflexota bacterium]|nr:LLM class flavin-dependent oxidoreductase [Chloroflexota bacterium]
MRFCLDFSQHPWQRAADRSAAARRMLAMAAAADAAGIDAIWATEDPDAWDAFALLGAFANVTTNALLGPGVTNPYHRNPNLIAASVATLDTLSGGRAVLGLGRGQPEWYARRLGVEVGDPLAALRETIALLRQWWAAPYQASSAADHRHFAIREWERTIAPIQAMPPIYIAAAGPKALALAGAVAEGVIFNSFASDPY